MTDSRIESLLSVLGYTDSVKYYHLLKDFPSLPSLSHLSRIFNQINKNENVEIFGAYSIKTDADEQLSDNLRPIVFVARAENLSEARRLHQDLWNSSSVPFVVILLPDEIKIYTGFDYDKYNEKSGLIESIQYEQIGLFPDLSNLAIAALRKYSAESINNGSIWQKLQNSPNFNYDNRVDKQLLKNLEKLEQELVKKLPDSLSEKKKLEYIHSIIGKYVYFRYLKDREILTEDWAKTQNLELDKVFGRGATLIELKKLSDAIETRFEGDIFPFPDDFEDISNDKDKLISDVASGFFGDTASGQLALFSIYDFSYIPVETLSYIYEQFLKSQGLTRKDGAVYTPESLADYLINEISSVKPLKRGMKILDPCCGSGIFLVLTYRYLVELELQNQNKTNLKPDELKQIMEESIYGVELNPEACQVTEFSLILILLNYIEPPDLAQNKRFKFPNLHNKNIFEGDFFNPEEFYPLTMNFDWIIGNPPWKALNIKKNPQDKNALKWVKDNGKSFPVGGNRVEEAFSWRATEFVANDGFIGFVISAKRLFNSTSKNFRKEFFKKNEVRRITNFSNFHYLLFQADVSAMTIIYQKADLDRKKKTIWHYSPFVANQVVSQIKKGKPTHPVWTIVINKSEISRVDAKEAERGEALTWKMAFWGSYEDERTFVRLRNNYSENLGQIVKKKHWELHEGLRLRTEGEKTDALDSSLFKKFGEDLKYFDGKKYIKNSYRFHIPPNFLKTIPKENQFIPKGAKSGLSLISAPHIVLNAQYAIYSNTDFVIKNLYGLASPIEDTKYLQAISLYLNSTICRYLLFFISPQWGIDVTKLDKQDWKKLPVPPLSENQINDLANLQEFLASKEMRGEDNDSLQRTLDENIENILRIPISIKLIVHDFFDVKRTLNKKRNWKKVKAVKNVEKTDLEKYALRLRDELDEIAEGGGEKHAVSIIYSKDLTVCQISMYKTNQTQEIRVEKANGKNKVEFENIKNDIQEKFSQWIYIEREVAYFDKNSENFFICKSSRLIDWVESKALSDANRFRGEVLANSKPNFRSISQSQVYGNNISKQL